MGDGDSGINAVSPSNPQELNATNQITGEINSITFLPFAQPTKANQMFINTNASPNPPILAGCPGILDEPYLEVYNSAYSASKYDNFYVAHSIPKTTLQYAWITSSYVRLNDPILGGYVNKDFKIIAKPSNKLHNSIDFVSSSDFVSSDAGIFGIIFNRDRTSPTPTEANYITILPTDFLG